MAQPTKTQPEQGKAAASVPNALDREQQRTDAACLLANEWRTGAIIKELCRKYGIHKRAAEKRLAEVIAEAREAGKATREEIRAESNRFYRELIRDAMSAKDRVAALRARERIDKLFGAEAPERHEHSGTLRLETADKFLASLPDDLRAASIASLPDE